MRINPINSINYSSYNRLNKNNTVRSTYLTTKLDSVSFCAGKHEAAKFWGGLFGGVGAVASLIAFVTTGGAATIPMLIGYTALSATSGAVIGHQIDKGAEKFEKEIENKEE